MTVKCKDCIYAIKEKNHTKCFAWKGDRIVAAKKDRNCLRFVKNSDGEIRG